MLDRNMNEFNMLSIIKIKRKYTSSLNIHEDEFLIYLFYRYDIINFILTH